MNPAAGRPDVSVVIPTHDRSASLLRLLRGLRDGSFPAARFEVLVVADGCRDDTVSAARSEPLPFPVRVLEQTPGRGAAAARNLGAGHASGGLLLFLDDDIEPGPHLLAEHDRAHAAGGHLAVAVGPPLPVRPPRADLDMIAAWAWWEEQFARMAQPGHRFGHDEVYGANLSVPAALFREVGGFNVDLKCREDGELGYRLIKAGARVLFVPAAWGRHHELRDLARLIGRKRAEGVADAGLARLHPELWAALRLSWPAPPWYRPLGFLRRSALSAPWLARLVLGGLAGVLPLLERLHLRGTWRQAQAGVMYGWYWVGVAEAVGSRHGLARLGADCLARTPAARPALEIDLGQGLEAGRRAIDSARPPAVELRFGPVWIGSLPPRPGAEALRGEHLAAAVGTYLPHETIAALTSARAVAHPNAPRLRPASPDRLAGNTPIPPVSVIIPAHNAASTLAEALGSLLRQSHPGWEAIVVDDGSTDETAAIAEHHAAHDGRIRVLHQARGGAAAARNTGLGAAVHPWVLFLDADDWLLPQALERLGAAVAASGAVDAVHGGWARVAVDGTVTETRFAPPDRDLFPQFAEYCAFPILVCLFRRELAARIGGFDPSLRTCEDWDFWQRLARLGARFARVNEKVAHYRMQPRSGATATDQVLPDGLAVIARGHAPDPRVSRARYHDGAPPANLAAARLRFVSWVAGIPVGRGQPAAGFLDPLAGDSAPGLSPVEVATNLFRTVPLSMARGAGAWDELWPRVSGEVASFLEALERHSGAWRLARRAMLVLERLTCDVSRQPRPFVRGSTFAVDIEITRPIEAVSAPAGAERAHCTVLAHGEPIGAVLLPVCDGQVTARVLGDAIAAGHAWPILRRFFAATRYRALELVRVPAGIALRLDGASLGDAVPDHVATDPVLLHDQVGWTVFLREVWGAHGLPADEFYQPGAAEDAGPGSVATEPWPVVELSGPLPRLQVSTPRLLVEVRVGGRPIGLLPVPSSDGGVTPRALRAAITLETGFELCRAVVREAILGQPFEGEGLRARLAARAGEHGARKVGTATCVPPSAAAELTPDWVELAGEAESTLGIARYVPSVIGTPGDRHAALPSEVRSDLEAAARVLGPPLLLGAGELGRIAYRPDVCWRPEPRVAPDPGQDNLSAPDPAEARAADRHHFEALFAAGADPWSYDTPYEQLKYRQTLSIIPEGRIGRALELACAEGRFTRLLAPRVEELIAADFSQVALQRAAEACRGLNVRFERIDLVTDDLPEDCELIVCSEVLYFLGGLEALRAAGRKMAEALAPGGYLVLAHANLQADDPDLPGFDWEFPYGARVIGETLAALPMLQWRREIRTGAYRIQLFQRRRAAAPGSDEGGLRVEQAEYAPPAPHVAARFRPARGRRAEVRGASPAGRGMTTLPILMYHRVAMDGPAATARYRVTPGQFETQLRYLREAGFASLTIRQWLAAARNRRPLPRRSVLFTFDDGYADFAETAWPLLQRHGFGALVFLVADHVGGTNRWDAELGAPVPLMDWDVVRRLAAEGVEFGSHSASHRPMTGLDPAAIAREAIRSRRVIADGLGLAVTAFAYPHGDTDAVVQHLVGACGYQAGFTCRPGRAGFHDAPLALPRIEVSGEDDLTTFIARLGD